MTLRDQGWEPVTPVGSRGEFTWRVWCDARRPPEADLMGWPEDADFLATFVEVADGEGRLDSGGIGGVREPGEQLRYCVGGRDGFPEVVAVRVAQDRPGILVETTRRSIEIAAAELGEPHYGMRFFAMPLDDRERLVAVASGDIRQEHIALSAR
ncbi:hypothetical protein [Nocardia beijingensis]|uniref:hypothetical protein n=1 Tax=Nocardia beijingensis TaxID=95162 RepID=UPI00082CC3C6|nr:hypothetical protein [Nocardia beijingensis]